LLFQGFEVGLLRGSHRAAVSKVRPGVLLILESLHGPAYVRNARMDILAANDVAFALYDGLVGDLQLTGEAMELTGNGLTIITYTPEPDSPPAEALRFLR
jgi:hypothetical protein